MADTKSIIDINIFSNLCRSYLISTSIFSSTQLSNIDSLNISKDFTSQEYCVNDNYSISYKFQYALNNDDKYLFIALSNANSTNINSLYNVANLTKCLLTYYFYKSANIDYSNDIVVSISTPNESNYYLIKPNYKSLEKSFNSLLELVLPLIKFESTNLDKSKKLVFPYNSIREGQYEFINESYKAIKHNNVLMVNAPTGIGKSVSSLYAAIKAKLDNYTDKIFYLTCKGTNYIILKETLSLLQKNSPLFNWILIQAKETQCLNNYEKFSSIYCSKSCKLTKDINGITYEEREFKAINELLYSSNAFDPEKIKETAQRFMVCPYELSLDISEYCDIVICDYNYVFDPSIRFKRYFEANVRNQKFTFLIDEAHNLPDRIKSIFSESTNNNELTEIYEKLIGYGVNNSIIDNFYKLICYLNTYKAQLDTNYYQTEKGEVLYGYYVKDTKDNELLAILEKIKKDFDGLLKNNTDFAINNIEYFRIKIIKAINILKNFTNKFKLFIEMIDADITYNLICIDPSEQSYNSLSMSNSTILFSASIIPIDYYQDLLGVRRSKTLLIDSPFPKENLNIIAYTGISTRLSDRKLNINEIIALINETITQKAGNYFAFFPSYDYLNMFIRKYKNDSINLFIQKPNMKVSERNAFIKAFTNPAKDTTNLGLCVLGGSFSEGVDLFGDNLIGSIVIGTGIPNLNSILNLTQEYYQNYYEKGKEYTYTYPGFNKVLQAAGRVIRSDSDKGIVILVDDRFGTEEYIKLFPKHWQNIKYINDFSTLRNDIIAFWQKNQKNI